MTGEIAGIYMLIFFFAAGEYGWMWSWLGGAAHFLPLVGILLKPDDEEAVTAVVHVRRKITLEKEERCVLRVYAHSRPCCHSLSRGLSSIFHLRPWRICRLNGTQGPAGCSPDRSAGPWVPFRHVCSWG